MDIQQLEKETQKQAGQISSLNTDMDWIKPLLQTFGTDIKEIKQKLLGRPTWLITTIFAVMMGIIGALLTYVANNLVL